MRCNHSIIPFLIIFFLLLIGMTLPNNLPLWMIKYRLGKLCLAQVVNFLRGMATENHNVDAIVILTRVMCQFPIQTYNGNSIEMLDSTICLISAAIRTLLLIPSQFSSMLQASISVIYSTLNLSEMNLTTHNVGSSGLMVVAGYLCSICKLFSSKQHVSLPKLSNQESQKVKWALCCVLTMSVPFDNVMIHPSANANLTSLLMDDYQRFIRFGGTVVTKKCLRARRVHGLLMVRSESDDASDVLCAGRKRKRTESCTSNIPSLSPSSDSLHCNAS